MVVVDKDTKKSYKNLCKNCKGKNWLVQCKCGHCNEVKPLMDKWGDPHLFVKGHSKRCENHHNWDGGNYVDQFGYTHVKNLDHPLGNGRKYVKKHRLIYEHYLSIILDEEVFIPKKYDIHHIIPLSKGGTNALINLQFMTKEEHTRIHRLGKRYSLKDHSKTICLICNKKTYVDKKGRLKWMKYEDGYICFNCYRRNCRRNKK